MWVGGWRGFYFFGVGVGVNLWIYYIVNYYLKERMHIFPHCQPQLKFINLSSHSSLRALSLIEEQQNIPLIQLKNNCKYHDNMCQRCTIKQQQIQCKICISKLCKQCDEQLHHMGKFITHPKYKIIKKIVEQGKNIINGRTLRQIKETSTFHDFQFQLTLDNIRQQWNKSIKQVLTSFEQLFNQLNLKKEELTQKLQKKKNQQLTNYMSTSQEHQLGQVPVFNPKPKPIPDDSTMRKSYLSDKQQMCHIKKKHKQCQHRDGSGRCIGKLSTHLDPFLQLYHMINKIDIKQIITKTICHQQLFYPKTKKTSLIINISPKSGGIKNSKYKSNKLSSSSSTSYFKVYDIKNNQEERDENKNQFHSVTMIQSIKSVKSDREILGNRKYFKSGIMI